MQIVEPALVQVGQQLHHRLAVAGVEVAGRLVGEQDARAAGEGAGDGNALLLAAGKLVRQMPAAVAHADPLECLRRAALALGRRHVAAISKRQLDVLEDGEIADEVEALEDKTDLAVADACPVGERQAFHLLTVEQIAAFGGRIEQAEDREQRRFAAARGAGDGDVFARLDFQINAGQRVGFDLVGEEDFFDAVEVNERFRFGHGIAEK